MITEVSQVNKYPREIVCKKFAQDSQKIMKEPLAFSLSFSSNLLGAGKVMPQN